jgi:hypothetical protein
VVDDPVDVDPLELDPVVELDEVVLQGFCPG